MALRELGGSLIAGYGYEDSQVQVSGGQVYAPVRWKTKNNVSALQGKTVVLQIEIKGAALYSFRFRS